MPTRLVKLFTLFCVLIQAIGASWSFADQPNEDAKTVKVGDHEITIGDVAVAGASGVIGHVVLDRTLKGTLNAYYEIEHDDFEKASDKLMSKNPEKVLYISSFREDEPSWHLAITTLLKRYGEHPNVRALQVSSPKDLISKLRALPQDSSFDRIEINMHGNGGLVSFADGTWLTRHDHPFISENSKYFDVEELIKANLKLAKPGADLRLNACRVADDLRSSTPIGRSFMSDLGKAFMPKGGHVFASEKVLLTIPMTYKTQLKIPLMGLYKRAKMLVKAKPIGYLPKSFRFRKDVVEVDIPARESSCAPALLQALKKAL